MTNPLDGDVLLKKHNPVLIAYPQAPRGKIRPGASQPGRLGWGDYHPCSAEFFLARSHLRDHRPGYDIAGLLPRTWRPLGRTEIPELKRKLRAAGEPEDTRDWELDVADVPSQSERKAWQAYGAMLEEQGESAYECAVYGRYIKGVSEGAPHALQYWYLYLYNDFRNNHEADWEMVTIELTPDGEPARVGLSSHHGGYQRPWDLVLKQGDQPIVHVALGSHAGYFEYAYNGHDILKFKYLSDLPGPLNTIISLVKRIPLIGRLRDKAAADPEIDQHAKPEHVGERVYLTLHVLPDDIDAPADPERWWWLRYRGRWGSSRPRIFGTVGVSTPWRKASDGPFRDWRWDDPLRWLNDCEKDPA